MKESNKKIEEKVNKIRKTITNIINDKKYDTYIEKTAETIGSILEFGKNILNKNLKNNTPKSDSKEAKSKTKIKQEKE